MFSPQTITPSLVRDAFTVDPSEVDTSCACTPHTGCGCADGAWHRASEQAAQFVEHAVAVALRRCGTWPEARRVMDAAVEAGVPRAFIAREIAPLDRQALAASWGAATPASAAAFWGC